MDLLGPCTNVFLTAYAHVRTEPQSDIGQTRGKKKPSGHRQSCTHLLGPCCFLPSCPLLPFLAPSPSYCCWSPLAFLPSRPCSLRLCWPATQSLSSLLRFLLLVIVCLVFSGLSVFVGLFCCCACCLPTEMTQDCRVLPAPSVHTHTRHRAFPLPLRVFWRLACPWLLLLFVCLGCSVTLSLWHLCLILQGAVRNCRPEPWTRLHCSEWHWRDVAPSVGQPGAPLLGCYVAMHCRYCTETKTLGKHLNSSAGIFSLGPYDSARLRNSFTVAAQAVSSQCFTDFACCARIVFPFDLERYSLSPSDELGEWQTTTLPQLRSCSP